MTLEEAQAEILNLKEQLATKDTEMANKDKELETLKQDNNRIREINQQYYLKLSAQYEPPKEDGGEDGDDNVPTCEEFAQKLEI